MSDGDAEKIEIVRRWQPALKAFFLRRIRNYAEAEDLTQEVLVRLLDQDQPRIDSYVFQTAQNLLTDRQRRHAVRDRYRQALSSFPDRELDMLDAHAIAEGKQELAIVIAALEALPERTRSIFILYRIEKLSQQEIALACGISVSAVKQQVAKAMAALARASRSGQ